jgi:hypothetical protein
MQEDATGGFSLFFFHQMSPVFKSEVFFLNKGKSKFSHVLPRVLVLNSPVAFVFFLQIRA